MADGKRTYRRTPQDIAEATHIHSLLKADLAARVMQLSQEGKLAELHSLLEYEKRWAGIVADLSIDDILTSDAQLRQQRAPSIAPAGHGVPTIETTPPDPASSATTQPTESTPGGGQQRSRTRTPQTA